MIELLTSKVMRLIRSQDLLVRLRVVFQVFDACVLVNARDCDTWVRNCFIALFLLKYVVVAS